MNDYPESIASLQLLDPRRRVLRYATLSLKQP